ncbi:MAG TPA: CRISPR-associated endonuclease Cas2 [Acidobacteriota bacterium]|nr:CRISPR-associated endonuclease Cas2 [Acidobacteriota bacterium]HQM63864.1 CRISPR-associated endonuclease Cas2 [Acidobacteriota bacterium]
MEEDVLIAYDIADNRRRGRLFRLLHRWGQPLQESVFHCRVRPGGLPRLRREVDRLIRHEEDGVLYCPLCPRCLDRMIAAGRQPSADIERTQII